MVMFRPEATRGNGASELKIRVHYDPDLRPEDVTTVHGIPVTTPARTLLDLATCVDDDELEQALANAIRRRLTTYAELHEVMARYPRHDGVARLGALLEGRG
jgi:predicted transcriptional regulator of viral defense system